MSAYRPKLLLQADVLYTVVAVRPHEYGVISSIIHLVLTLLVSLRIIFM